MKSCCPWPARPTAPACRSSLPWLSRSRRGSSALRLRTIKPTCPTTWARLPALATRAASEVPRPLCGYGGSDRRHRPCQPISPRLYASLADYDGHSFSTYRWQPAADLKTYVYRALDDAVFRADLERRPRPLLTAADLQVFPPEAVDPAWASASASRWPTGSTLGTGSTRKLRGRRSRPTGPYDGLRVLAGSTASTRSS